MTQKWNLQDIRPAEPKPAKNSRLIKGGRLSVDGRKVSNGNEKRTIGDIGGGNREIKQDDGLSLNLGKKQVTGEDEIVETIRIRDNKKSKRFNFIILAIVVVLLFGGIIGVNSVLTKTTLTITPESREQNVNAEFIAYPERREGSLSYEILSFDVSGEKQVKATGQTHIEEKARGMIEIMKTTAGSERLVNNTRFRSPDGLIFRLQEAVVVPGAVTGTDGKLVPGSISVEVVADGVGSEYNLPSGTKFDVPGFKESNLDALYNAIYAINKADLSGGFNGPQFTLDENDLDTSKQALEIELRDKLIAQINDKKPAGFIIFPESIAITYSDLPTVKFGEDLVSVRVQATLQAPLFKDDEFASFIAKETITTYDHNPVEIRNIEDLKFSYLDNQTSFENIANLEELSFSIIGKPFIVWDYDPEQIRKDLAGKALTASKTILPAYPGVKNMRVSGKPFWKNSFPDDYNKIILEEDLEKK